MSQNELSKYALARMLGVNRQAVYAWLHGEYNPAEKHRQQIKEQFPNAVLQPNYKWKPKPEESKTTKYSIKN